MPRRHASSHHGWNWAQMNSLRTKLVFMIVEGWIWAFEESWGIKLPILPFWNCDRRQSLKQWPGTASHLSLRRIRSELEISQNDAPMWNYQHAEFLWVWNFGRWFIHSIVTLQLRISNISSQGRKWSTGFSFLLAQLSLKLFQGAVAECIPQPLPAFCRTPSAFEALCCHVLVATCRRGHYFFLCKLWVPFRLQGAREGSSTCAAEREGAWAWGLRRKAAASALSGPRLP